MKPAKLSGILLTAVVVLLGACSKKGPSYTQYIPKDASYVVAMDVKSMIEKLEKDSLSVENMLEVMKDSANPSKYSQAINLWNQFKDAGLDLDNKIMVAVPVVDMNAGNIDLQVLAGLKDEGKLEAFIAKLPDAPKVTKENGISYAMADDWLIGWNKDAVMILGDHSTPRMRDSFLDDSTANTLSPAMRPGSQVAMTDRMKKYFALKKDESIASVKAFTDLVGEKGDIEIYTNSGNLAGAQAGMSLAMMPKVKELLDGIYSTSLVNFEDGKMVMNSNTYTGPKLSEILKKYAGPTVDMALLDPYPSNNVGGVAAFSFDPQLIPAFLKETGFDALADLGLQQQGITTADVVKAFKGDFAVIFSDFNLSNVEKTAWDGNKYMGTEPSAKLLVAVRIGDKASFEKLLGLATRTGMFVKQGNRLMPASNGVIEPNAKIFLGVENDLLLFSTDETVYKSYVAKSSKIGLADDVRNTIKGSSIAFFIDAQKILNGIPESMFDSTSQHEQKILARSKSVFKTLSFTTENFDGKKIPGHGELTMIDNKNSLPQLVRFLMFSASEMKMKSAENEAKWNEQGAPDSTIIELAPAQ